MKSLGQLMFGDITINIISNSPSLTVAELHIPAGTTAKLHSHIQEEVNYVVKGKVRCLCNGQSSISNEGDSIQVPPNSEHSLICFPENNALVLSIWTPSRTDFMENLDHNKDNEEKV